MNGNCYYSEGVNPTITTNKNEGNKIAIPVLTPERGEKRQNGRRFKEDGEESFTLTAQDRHGVAIGIGDLYANRGPRFYDEETPTLRSDRHGLKAAIDVEPIEMSGNKLSESDDVAHTLNTNDQRKVFGAHQTKTMVGYNATLNKGGGMTQIAHTLNARDYKGLAGQQMMTIAAMCLQSTKDICQKNEKSLTVSPQKKTEGLVDTHKRER